MSTLSISPAFSAPRSVRMPQSGVRLTRRGRLAVFFAALAFILFAALMLGSVAVGSETSGQPEPTQIVMVSTGDTLWGIAAAINTDGDVRSTMADIERLNALDSVVLSAGQKLRVPVSDD